MNTDKPFSYPRSSASIRGFSSYELSETEKRGGGSSAPALTYQAGQNLGFHGWARMIKPL